MADTFDETGLFIDSFEDRVARVKTKVREAIDELFELTPDTAEGQVVLILLDSQQGTADLQQELYATIDPDEATGTGLDAVCSMTGTQRKPQTQGKVTLRCNLDGGTTLTGGDTQAWSEDNPETTVVLDEDFTAPVGPADDYDLVFTFIEYGKITAPAGTIDTIKTPVTGWNSVTNPADADPGDEREFDQDLRERRVTELTLGGSTSPDSLQAELSDIITIEKVVVKNNPRPISQEGMPPNSIEPVIWDGDPPTTDNDLIAETIYREGPGGIQSYGTTVVPYTDAQGNVIDIGFTRAIKLRVELEFTLTTGSSYPGDDDFKATIAAWDESNLSIGDNVIRSKLICVASSVSGVEDVVDLRLRFYGEVWGTTNLTVGTREIARIDSGDITVL